MTRLKDVECLGLENKPTPAKQQMFRLQVNEQNGSSHVVFRDYFAFFGLKAELKEHYGEMKDVEIPELPSLKFFQRGMLFGKDFANEKKKKAVDDFCQALKQLPDEIWNSKIVKMFFEQTAVDRQILEKCSRRKTSRGVTQAPDISELQHGLENMRDREISLPLSADARSTNANKSASPQNSRVASWKPSELSYLTTTSYQRRMSGEVSIEEGEVVDVLQKSLSGWWFVHLDNKKQEGWVPAAYLEPLFPTEEESDPNYSSVTIVTEGAASEAGRLGRMMTVSDHQADNEDEVSYRAGQIVDVLTMTSDGWWTVRCQDGTIGKTPVSNLSQLPPSEEITSDDESLYGKISTDMNHSSSFYSKGPPPRNTSKSNLELYATVNMAAKQANRQKQEPRKTTYTEVEIIKAPGSTNKIHDKLRVDYVEVNVKALPPFKKPMTKNPSVEHAGNPPEPCHVTNSDVSHLLKDPAPSRSHTYENVTMTTEGMKLQDDVKYKVTAKWEPPFPKLPGLPLVPGDIVKIMKQEGDYCYCNLLDSENCRPIKQGWTHTSVLRPVSSSPESPCHTPPPVPRKSPTMNPKKNSVGFSIQHEPWYAGRINRHDCETLLSHQAAETDFLIRESTSRVGDYTLSVLFAGRVRHFPIELTQDKRYYIGNYKFKDLKSVIKHYQQHALFYSDQNEEVMLGKPFIVKKK